MGLTMLPTEIRDRLADAVLTYPRLAGLPGTCRMDTVTFLVMCLSAMATSCLSVSIQTSPAAF